MKIEVITQATKVEIKRIIQNALDGGYPIEFEGVYPSVVEEALKEIGVTLNDDYDFNGWQSDFWSTFVYNNQEYNFNGGAWYGTTYIGKSEEN